MLNTGSLSGGLTSLAFNSRLPLAISKLMFYLKDAAYLHIDRTHGLFR